MNSDENLTEMYQLGDNTSTEEVIRIILKYYLPYEVYENIKTILTNITSLDNLYERSEFSN